MTLLAVAATGDAQGILVKNGQKIVFMGDSITAMGGAPAGYCQQVIRGLEANGIKVTMICAGVGGNKSNQMLARMDWDVIRNHPEWMTLSCGVNDVCVDLPLEEFKQNMTKIVAKAKAAKINVIILTATAIGEDPAAAKNREMAPYNAFLHQLAHEMKCPLADLNADIQQAVIAAGGGAQSKRGNVMTPEGVHPNALGHEVMALGVLKAMGLTPAQLQKARSAWLDIPHLCDVDLKGGLTLRQYEQLDALAAKQNRPASELICELVSKTLAGAGASPAATSANSTTIHPVRDNTMLLNPGKGWVQYDGSDNPQYTRDYISVIYFRPTWSMVEPKENQFNWKVLDDTMEQFDEKSIYGRKMVAFGIINIDGGMGQDYPAPKWVFDAGAEPLAVPDSSVATGRMIITKRWDDPVFLDRFKKFVKVLGERYDSNPNIAFIDIRSYGNSGEGHIGHLGNEVRLASPEVLKEHYYLPYFKAFPRTRLMIPWGNPLYDNVYDWAVSQGAGIRRDGILSIYSKDGSECLRAYGHSPSVFEYCWSYEQMAREKSWSKEELMNYIRVGKPSYMQWNTRIFEENKEFCLQLGNKIGYHFVLEKAILPTSLKGGHSCDLTLTWQNDGVAYLYEPSHPAVALLDQNNRVIEKQWASGSNPKSWEPDRITNETWKVNFSSAISQGTCKLAIGLFLDRNDTNPAYRIGIQGRTADGWYVLSTVGVGPATNRSNP